MPAPRLAGAARTEFLKPKSITSSKARVLGPRLGGASAASFLKAASHSETQEYDGHRTITAPRFEPLITGDRAGVSMGVGAMPVTLVSKTNDGAAWIRSTSLARARGHVRGRDPQETAGST